MYIYIFFIIWISFIVNIIDGRTNCFNDAGNLNIMLHHITAVIIIILMA
jgi:low affinity Fe/Cu permease